MKNLLRRFATVCLIMFILITLQGGFFPVQAAENEERITAELNSGVVITKGYELKKSDITVTYYSGSRQEVLTTSRYEFYGSSVISQDNQHVKVIFITSGGKTLNCDLLVSTTSMKLDRIVAKYIGDRLTSGSAIDPNKIQVTAFWTLSNGSTMNRDLAYNEFTISPTIMGSSDQVITVTYAHEGVTKSDTVTIFTTSSNTSNNTNQNISSKKLSYIEAEYNGDPVEVGGRVRKSDISVEAYYSVVYTDGTKGTISEEVTSGWSIGSYTISSGTNRITITYREDGITKSDTIRVSSMDTTGDWVEEGDYWRYQYEDGTYMVGDWLRSGGRWYLLDEYGYLITNGFAYKGGHKYYFDNRGVMQTGWHRIDGNWYFFNSSGAMQTGWIQTGGLWYLLDRSGVMQTGWQFKDGKWYFLNPSGEMITGWKHDGVWYYLNSDGTMATGWIYTGGRWYYLDSGGGMLTGWIMVAGKWYYLEQSGAMAANQWIGSYYVDGTGAWVNIN